MICNSLPHIYHYISIYHILSHLQWVSMASCNIFFDHQNGIRHWKNPRRTRLYSTMGSKADCRRFFARRRSFELRRHRWQRCATAAAPRAKAQRGPWPWPWSQLEEQSWENLNGKIMENQPPAISGNGEMIETSELVPRTQKKNWFLNGKLIRLNDTKSGFMCIYSCILYRYGMEIKRSKSEFMGNILYIWDYRL